MNKKNNVMMIDNDEILFVNENEVYNYEKVINKENLPASVIVENYDLSILKEITQTPELCLAIVKEDGFALQYIDEQTPEICLEAVKKYGIVLKYVKSQTDEICLTAVKQDGHALQYVKNQTKEICVEAVKQDDDALQYVKNQTLDICLIAINNKPLTLEYVENQTEDICIEAVKKDINAVLTIRNIETRNKVLSKLKPTFFYKSIKKYGHDIVDYLIEQHQEYKVLSKLNEEMLDIVDNKTNADDIFNTYPDIEKIYHEKFNNIITFDYNDINKILTTYYDNRRDHIDKNIKIHKDKEFNDWFKDIIMY